ncbi:hypothetical protein MMC07_005998 [Pseudocyphellaria aurata]|nr:hypothetical protein [Pseudocyphellaria aurata]
MLSSNTILLIPLLATAIFSAPTDSLTSTIAAQSDAPTKRETPSIASNNVHECPYWLIDECEDPDVPPAKKSPVPSVSEIAKVIKVERDLALFYTSEDGFAKVYEFQRLFHPNLKYIHECTPREYYQRTKWDDYWLFINRWSIAFSVASSGTVHVLVPPRGPKNDSNWLTDEWPILNGKNPNVDQVIQVDTEDFENTTIIYEKTREL